LPVCGFADLPVRFYAGLVLRSRLRLRLFSFFSLICGHMFYYWFSVVLLVLVFCLRLVAGWMVSWFLPATPLHHCRAENRFLMEFLGRWNYHGCEFYLPHHTTTAFTTIAVRAVTLPLHRATGLPFAVVCCGTFHHAVTIRPPQRTCASLYATGGSWHLYLCALRVHLRPCFGSLLSPLPPAAYRLRCYLRRFSPPAPSCPVYHKTAAALCLSSPSPFSTSLPSCVVPCTVGFSHSAVAVLCHLLCCAFFSCDFVLLHVPRVCGSRFGAVDRSSFGCDFTLYA